LCGDWTFEYRIRKAVVCAIICVVNIGAGDIGKVGVLKPIPAMTCDPPVCEGLHLSHVNGVRERKRLVVRARKVDGLPQRGLFGAVEHGRDVAKVIAASI